MRRHGKSNWLDTEVEFDASGFARTVAAVRHERHMSTRELSRAAGISQAYVVALERARTPGHAPGPTPTVDVVARLAHALGMEPRRLFERALRPVGRHVLFIVDELGENAFRSVREVTGPSVETWLTTTRQKPASLADIELDGPHPIRLHDNAKQAYKSKRIEKSLHLEVQRLAPFIGGRRIGLMFDEMSAVMAVTADASKVIAEERRWSEAVTGETTSVGVHAVWNVCVYQFAAIEALPDPVSAAIELATSHDMVWNLERGRVAVGANGMRRFGERLRPQGVSQRDWIAMINDRVASSERLSMERPGVPIQGLPRTQQRCSEGSEPE